MSKKPGLKKETPEYQEAKRLEDLWAGNFGHDYRARNSKRAEGRARFWREFLAKHPAESVLEVGCNIGLNLEWIAPEIGASQVTGMDINEEALKSLRERVPGVQAVQGAARELPFGAGAFDLSFTSGVLIHQPEASLPQVMSEILRVSKRFVLCMEYYAEESVEIKYRGQDGALFKRDYGRLYQNQFRELRQLDRGFLGKDAGWDDITYWLFEKR